MADGLKIKDEALYVLLNHRFLSKSEIARELYVRLENKDDKRKSAIKLHQKEKERQEITEQEIDTIVDILKDFANELKADIVSIEMRRNDKKNLDEAFKTMKDRLSRDNKSVDEITKAMNNYFDKND